MAKPTIQMMSSPTVIPANNVFFINHTPSSESNKAHASESETQHCGGFGDGFGFEWTKWLAAGAMLELLTLLVPGDLRDWGKAAVVGAGVHLGKLAALTLAGLILRVPVALLLLGLGWSATTHVLFGVLGGLLGAMALRELRKIPFLEAQARGR